MPPKKNQRRDLFDEDEGLDTQIDPNEEEDIPEEDEPSRNKAKGKRVFSEDEDEEEDPDGDRLEAVEQENHMLRARLEELLAEHRHDVDRASRPAATAGASSSNASAARTDAPAQSSNAPSGSSDRRKRPPNPTISPSQARQQLENKSTSSHYSSSYYENDPSIRIPPPRRKDDVTIEEIQHHLGLDDTIREDHLIWLEWRELIRSWFAMANLDKNLTWKHQDKARVGTLITMIRERIPRFQRFVGNWAAEYLVQDYFNHYRSHRLKKARDADGSSPAKKKQRVAQTETDGNAKRRDATPEGEDEPRARKTRPTARPPPPQEDAEPHNNQTTGNEGSVEKAVGADGGGRNDPHSTSPSKSRRTGGTGTKPPNKRAPPQEKDDDATGDTGGSGGAHSSRANRSGRGLDIPMNSDPPPLMSTRSRTRPNTAQNGKRADEDDAEGQKPRKRGKK